MVGAIVAATVMRVLLFVWDVSMLRECGSVRVTAMLVWGMGVVWLLLNVYVFGSERGGMVGKGVSR